MQTVPATRPDTPEGAFADASADAARAFRAILSALARPGRIETLPALAPPAPLSPAAAAALLTLCDRTTPVHLAGRADCAPVRAWLAFHTGSPVTDAAICSIAVGDWPALQPLARYPAGTPDYPDRSATLIVEMPSLAGEGTALSGPGIAPGAPVSLPLPDPETLSDNAARFPCGLDFLFTCGAQVAGLPRSTRIG